MRSPEERREPSPTQLWQDLLQHRRGGPPSSWSPSPQADDTAGPPSPPDDSLEHRIGLEANPFLEEVVEGVLANLHRQPTHDLEPTTVEATIEIDPKSPPQQFNIFTPRASENHPNTEMDSPSFNPNYSHQTGQERIDGLQATTDAAPRVPTRPETTTGGGAPTTKTSTATGRKTVAEMLLQNHREQAARFQQQQQQQQQAQHLVVDLESVEEAAAVPIDDDDEVIEDDSPKDGGTGHDDDADPEQPEQPQPAATTDPTTVTTTIGGVPPRRRFRNMGMGRMTATTTTTDAATTSDAVPTTPQGRRRPLPGAELRQADGDLDMDGTTLKFGDMSPVKSIRLCSSSGLLGEERGEEGTLNHGCQDGEGGEGQPPQQPPPPPQQPQGPQPPEPSNSELLQALRGLAIAVDGGKQETRQTFQ